MKVNANLEGTKRKLERLTKYLTRDVYEVIGTESVNHFQDSFHNEGFTDKSLRRWKNVKRRDPSSSWYGFKYGSKRNFSDAATKRPVLSGETGELFNSIQYRVVRSKKRVVIFSDVPYAKIHNQGGNVKVFGKAKAKMPKRQFMGKSQVLNKRIVKVIKADVSKILRS